LPGQYAAHRPCDASSQNGKAWNHRQVLRLVADEQQTDSAKPDHDRSEQPHLERLTAKYEEFQNYRGDGQGRLND
jgi:hypothetical protein